MHPADLGLKKRFRLLKECRYVRILQTLAGVLAIIYLLTMVNGEELLIATKKLTLSNIILCGSLSLIHLLASSMRWYIFIPKGRKKEASYFDVVRANLQAHSFLTSLPMGVGHLIKPKLLPGKYTGNLLSLMLSQAMEMNALLFIFIFMKTGAKACVTAMIVWMLAVLVGKRVRGSHRLLKKIRKATYGRRWSWHEAHVFAGVILGAVTLMAQATGLVLSFKSFGVEISMKTAILAVLFSHGMGVISPFPGGLGGSELGIALVTGQTTTSVLAAFTYKLIFQYAYSVAGSLLLIRKGVER